MNNNRMFILWVIIVIFIIYVVIQMPQSVERSPQSILQAYHDQILVMNNQMLVECKGQWKLSDKRVWKDLFFGVLHGEMLEPETTSLPAKIYNFRLIAEGRWDAGCYLDFKSGIVYLNKVMEGEGDGSYRMVRLSEEELSSLKHSLERNLLRIRSEE